MANNIHTKGNPGFISTDVQKIKIIYIEIFTLKTFLTGCNQNAEGLRQDAKNLVLLLHDEYNL